MIGLSLGLCHHCDTVKKVALSASRPLAGDREREANTGEVKSLRKEARDMKEVVAEQALELRLFKKSMTGLEGDEE